MHTFHKFSNNKNGSTRKGLLKMTNEKKKGEYFEEEKAVEEVTEQIMNAYDSGYLNENAIENTIENTNKKE